MVRKLFMLLTGATLIISQLSAQDWTAKRITAKLCQSASNSWYNFRKDITVDKIPDVAMARIACDSKYWLWINGEMAVFEGQLKRGPTPRDTYFDEVDIAPYLREGDNTIAILVWYFGKHGFSHKSSGQAGLAFQCDALQLVSNRSWQARIDPGFESTDPPHPNYRLPESNIRFDAREGDFDWIKPENKVSFGSAREIGKPDSPPWNNLMLRPIPHWKDFGERKYENDAEIPQYGTGDWIICKLPYNCHITPILDIEAPDGLTIKMQTDNFDYMGLDVASVRAEYVTREGTQQYESPGWMNGHIVKYLIPEGVKINALTYRETGYNSEFTGSFTCENPFYNKLWTMSARTLYVNMRDNYTDCPDRERAPWWADAVIESGQAFYALSPSSASLTRKGILELIHWQREDSILFSPAPAGNYDRELPGQMLASIGHYGFWNYYQNTGDKQTIAEVFQGVKKYLDVWQLKPDGTLVIRQGDWYWGDWGLLKDIPLLYNAWYYLALKGFLQMSEMLGKTDEAALTRNKLTAFHAAFNNAFWDGNGYRTPDYEGKYDDRAQALTVVSGLAAKDQYDALLKIFQSSYLASPYMEKYVLEALFVMEEEEFGLHRMKERYNNMVTLSPLTTLYENFGPRDQIDKSSFIGFGTNNHGWSGGALTILSQYVAGISPIEPAFKIFRVRPQLGSLKQVKASVHSISGMIEVEIDSSGTEYEIKLKVPDGTKAHVYLPLNYASITANDEKLKEENKMRKRISFALIEQNEEFIVLAVPPGDHVFVAKK